MRMDLYKRLAKLAKDEGQTTAHLLDRAAEHYLQFLAPAENTVRPEVTSHARRSIKKNRNRLKLLAW